MLRTTVCPKKGVDNVDSASLSGWFGEPGGRGHTQRDQAAVTCICLNLDSVHDRQRYTYTQTLNVVLPAFCELLKPILYDSAYLFTGKI